jgi:hypothetical protein
MKEKLKQRPLLMDDALYEKATKAASKVGLSFAAYVRMLVENEAKIKRDLDYYKSSFELALINEEYRNSYIKLRDESNKETMDWLLGTGKYEGK